MCTLINAGICTERSELNMTTNSSQDRCAQATGVLHSAMVGGALILTAAVIEARRAA